MHWKTKLGHRLKELREQSNRGKGITHERVAALTGMSKAYVIRLETHMNDENPTLDKLEKMVALYGREMTDLFESVVEKKDHPWQHRDLHEKLDFILMHGGEHTAIGITENIHAMYDRSRRVKTKTHE